MATTTIQVSKETVQLLKKLKEQTKSPSFDEVIRSMTKKRLLVKKSFFGSLGKARGMKEIIGGLRDEQDRKL